MLVCRALDYNIIIMRRPLSPVDFPHEGMPGKLWNYYDIITPRVPRGGSIIIVRSVRKQHTININILYIISCEYISIYIHTQETSRVINNFALVPSIIYPCVTRLTLSLHSSLRSTRWYNGPETEAAAKR